MCLRLGEGGRAGFSGAALTESGSGRNFMGGGGGTKNISGMALVPPSVISFNAGKDCPGRNYDRNEGQNCGETSNVTFENPAATGCFHWQTAGGDESTASRGSKL